MDHELQDDIHDTFAILGPAARRACDEVAERMADDPALRARIDRRHALMAEAYVEEHAGASLATARQAGRRAYLIALLIEARREAPTSPTN